MHIALPVIGALALIASLPAAAVTTVYTSQASFSAAVAPGSYFEDFTRPTFAIAPALFFNGPGFTYAARASTQTGAPSQVYLSGSFLGNAFGNEPLTLTFTSGNPTAVGGNFYLSNSDDEFAVGPVTITLSDGTVTTFSPTSAADSYRGFISTVPIAALSFAAPGSLRFNTIDNLTVGVGVVPEPSTWLLMAFGVAGLLHVRRGLRLRSA